VLQIAEDQRFDFCQIDLQGLYDVSFSNWTNYAQPVDYGASAFRVTADYGGNYAGQSEIYNSNVQPTSLSGVGFLLLVGSPDTEWTVDVVLTPAE